MILHVWKFHMRIKIPTYRIVLRKCPPSNFTALWFIEFLRVTALHVTAHYAKFLRSESKVDPLTSHILASFPGSLEHELCIDVESLVCFLRWSWRNGNNKTRVFRTERQHLMRYLPSTLSVYDIRSPIARCVGSCPIPSLFILFWVFGYTHTQLRSLYPLYPRHCSSEKKYQALSTCTTSISRSRAEEPGTEANIYSCCNHSDVL